jgi:hypothetical protein
VVPVLLIKTGEKPVRLIVCTGISMIKNEDKLGKKSSDWDDV